MRQLPARWSFAAFDDADYFRFSLMMMRRHLIASFASMLPFREICGFRLAALQTRPAEAASALFASSHGHGASRRHAVDNFFFFDARSFSSPASAAMNIRGGDGACACGQGPWQSSGPTCRGAVASGPGQDSRLPSLLLLVHTDAELHTYRY